MPKRTHSHQAGATLILHPEAKLFTGGNSPVSTSDFNGYNDNETDLSIPNGTQGVLQILVKVELVTVADTLQFLTGFHGHKRATFKGNWDFRKDSGRVSFARGWNSSYREYGSRKDASGPWDADLMGDPDLNSVLTCECLHSQDGSSARLRFGWDFRRDTATMVAPGFSKEIKTKTTFAGRDNFEFVVHLTTPVPAPVVARPSVTRTVSIGPFRTGSTELEQGVLSLAVRDWYESLNNDTRRRIENAQDRIQMPGSQRILIQGFASSAGGQGENIDLSMDRAKRVAEYLRNFSGNHNLSCITQTGVGELPRTDDPRLETNDPGNRVVIITYCELM